MVYEHILLDHRTAFDTFESNVCHLVKMLGDIEFLKDMLLSKIVFTFYEREWFSETLYMVGMIDYLSKRNDIPLYNGFDWFRTTKLDHIIYPPDVYLRYKLTGDENILKESFEKSIPEFKRFNIVEVDVDDVV